MIRLWIVCYFAIYSLVTAETRALIYLVNRPHTSPNLVVAAIFGSAALTIMALVGWWAVLDHFKARAAAATLPPDLPHERTP